MSFAQASNMLPSYQNWWNKHEEAVLDSYLKFLRFKTISAEASSRVEMHTCCMFLKDFLSDMGFKMQVFEGSHPPILLGSYHVSDSYPTVLFYNHYDVQPVDPLHLWKSPPFDPMIKEGTIYARGASDNKGQCFYTLNGIKAFLSTMKDPKVNIKVLIEGEEEVGSLGLDTLLHHKTKELKADCLLLVDVDIPSLEEPTLTLGCRGIVTMTIKCVGSSSDLHSGCFGGVAYNPLKALTQVLAKCWDEKGRVVIDHFYDDIQAFNNEGLFSLDYKPLLKEFGIDCLHREEGYTTQESNWTRPTLEINGLHGGYGGEGFKTVLPAEAVLKISARLVPGQHPDKVSHAIAQFFMKHLPQGMKVDIEKGHGGEAFRTPVDASFVKLVKESFEDVMKKDCGYILAGGSIPIGTSLEKATGAEVIGMGYALPTDAIHAPNEHFSWECFEKGLLTIATFLEKVSNLRQRES